jgi:hypothetical protein
MLECSLRKPATNTLTQDCGCQDQLNWTVPVVAGLRLALRTKKRSPHHAYSLLSMYGLNASCVEESNSPGRPQPNGHQ